jgi:hypothetical protein
MDIQTLFNLALGTTSGVLGWFARELWSAVKELKADLAKLREELPKEYVSKNDFKDVVVELKALLINISNKLDTKEDK